jgi:FHA domain-containing protein
MAKLILSLERSVLREIPLDRERITIGRKPQNDIRIENLAVSAEHARIVTILGDSFLEDLDSTNGTLVNGSPVKKHILQANDVIEIGKYKLKYVTDAPAVAQRPVEIAERTVEIRGAKIDAAPSSVAVAVEPDSKMDAAAVDESPEAAIRILNGGNAGKSLDLTKPLTTLGKPGVQVIVIARRPHGYFLIHVEGNTYPCVNGKPVGPQAHPLQSHDLIELGGIKMEFFLRSS